MRASNTVVFVCAVALVFATAAECADRLVATTGTDSGTCEVAACLTLAYAVGQAVTGESVLVAPGSYALTATLVVATPGIRIESTTPRAAVLLQPTLAKPETIRIAGVANVAIVGFSFRIAGGAFTTGGGVQVAAGSTNALVDNCAFTSTTPTALTSANCVKFGAGVGVVGPATTATITGCLFDKLSCCSTGGGVYAAGGGTVRVLFSTFSNNYISGAGGVGGAAIFYGSLAAQPAVNMEIGNSTFVGNAVAFRNGGAVYASTNGIGNYYGLTFGNNSAVGGGALYDFGAVVTATELTIKSNTAFQEGGAYTVAVGSTLDLSNSLISLCSAQDGGGVFAKDAASVSMRGVTFTTNQAQFGAAASLKDGTGTFTIAHSRFAGNRASDRGGAVLVRAQHLAVFNSTFDNNRGTSAGGAIDVQQTAVVSIYGTVFVRNAGDTGGAVYSAGSSKLNVTESVVEHNTASTGGGVYFAQLCTAFISNTRFTSNSGLSAGGSIYAVDTSVATFDGCTLETSIAPYGGGCAFFERAATVTMFRGRATNCTSPSGEGGAIFARQTVRLTLRSMVFEDNETGSVGGGVYAAGTVALTIANSTFVHNSAATDGGGVYAEREAVLTIDDSAFTANYAPSSGGISINAEATLYAARISVRDHSLDHTLAAPIGNGAGMGCTGTASAAIADSVFRDNTAAGSGGGMYTLSCIFNITRTSFLSNTAAIFGGGVHSQHDSTFIDSVFNANSAKWGGGLYALSDDLITRPSSPISGTSFVANTAAGAGGGVYWEGTKPIFDPACSSCTFTTNSAAGYGANEATAASRIVILVRASLGGTDRGSPPLSIEASRAFEVNVQIVDYYNATFAFGDPSARREMTAEVTAESIPVGTENATIIGSNLVTVIDGFADFSGLLLRGSKTRIDYNLVMQTQPASGITKWKIFLEQCEAGFAEVAHPVFLFECIECPSGQFDLVRASYCNNCPEGAVCEGLTRIFALEDWWWDEEASDANPRLYYCIPNRCCPVSQPGNRCVRTLPCADGWNQTSRLCSRCEEGRYEWNNKCIECGSSAKWRFVLVFIICLAFVLILFGFGSKLGGEMRIFIFYLQATVLIVGPVHPVMPFFGMAMGQLDVLSLDDQCFVRLTAFEKLVSQFAVPFLMVGILACITVGYVAVLTLRRNKIKAVAGGEHVPWINTTPFFDAFINLFGICTVPLLHTSFQLLICRKVGRYFVLNQAPDVECYRGGHAKWVVFATVLTTFYVILFPMIVYYRRRTATQRILSQRFWQRNLDLLRKSIYKLHMFWWEVLLIVRDALLVLNYVLFFSKPKRRTLALLMICFLFFFVHAYGLPFRDAYDNFIETISLTCLCYTSFAWSYANRFQLSNERTDALVKNFFLYFGFAAVSVYISLRVGYDLIGRFFLPMYAVQPSSYDIHHTPHT